MSPKMKNPVNIKVNGVLVLFDVLKVLEAGINLPAGRQACNTSENFISTAYFLRILFQFQILNISPAFWRHNDLEILQCILT